MIYTMSCPFPSNVLLANTPFSWYVLQKDFQKARVLVWTLREKGYDALFVRKHSFISNQEFTLENLLPKSEVKEVFVIAATKILYAMQ